jgi:TolB protein
VDRFEVVVNGEPLQTAPGRRSIDEEIPLTHSSWIAARAIGPWSRLVLNDIQAFAHTSPVYVQFGNERIAHKADAQFWIEWIDKLIAQVNQRGRFATPERKREVVELFQRGQEVYRGIEKAAAR